MDSSIVAAVISGLVAVIVAVINTNTSMQKILSELKEHNAVQDTKIESLTEEVRKHNEVIERTYRLESEVAVLKAQQKGN